MNKLNRIIESYPPELKFLLVCCGSERWKAEDLLPNINWELFLQWVKRHRVNPAVYRYIKNNPTVLPEEVSKNIEQRYSQITKRNLLLANETIRICSSLEKEGITAIPLKGVFLSKLFNNDYNFRETRDIDILINVNAIKIAIPVLTNLDYTKKLHESDNFTKSSFQKTNHHFVLNNSEKRTSLETHWNLLVFNEQVQNTQKSFFKNALIDDNTHIRLAQYQDHMNFVILHGYIHWWHALQWLLDAKEYFKIKNQSLEPDVYLELADIFLQTEILINLLFSNKNEQIFTRQHQITNIKNSLKVISYLNTKKLMSPITRLKRIGLFFDFNRNKKIFWIS
jgi:hypothetical protein